MPDWFDRLMSALEESVQGWEAGANQADAHFCGSEHAGVSQKLLYSFALLVQGVHLPEQVESDEVHCLIV